MHNIHDRGYKKLFSNTTIFRQLIETFVRQEWVKDLDFTQCETLDKTFIADHYKETESDIIYKVKLKGRDAYVMMLIEFQSTVDRFMVLRVLNYLASFYMDYVQSNEGVTMLPPVFPIVLYNGDRNWTAPLTMREVIDDHTLLGQYAPVFEYFPIVERAYLREDLLKIRNMVSTLFLAEAYYDVEMVKQELISLFQHEDRQAMSLLVNWFLQLKEHGRITPVHYEELERVYHDAQEVRIMLETALAQERQRWREEGIQKGELIGSIRTLQMVFRRPVSEEQDLRKQEVDALQKMFQDLEAVMKDSPMMS